MSAARSHGVLAAAAVIAAALACGPGFAGEAASSRAFVVVSPRDSRYFELSDGSPYIPIGLNMIHPSGGSAEEGLAQMEAWMQALAENGGNYLRIWLSSPFWDVEDAKAGVYDTQKARRKSARG